MSIYFYVKCSNQVWEKVEEEYSFREKVRLTEKKGSYLIKTSSKKS